MTNTHFRILYRQFLFRLMDVELLAASARGDASELFGQFAAMLILISFAFSYAAMAFGHETHAPQTVWLAERLMIEATMLIIGIFAILSWESTFPDRRDVQILSPLPVRVRDLFTAKTAAAASALGLTVAVLNCLSGFAWPLAMAPPGTGFLGTLRFIAAFWITLAVAGTFLYCAVLSVQGIAAQLPRGWFLRLSSFLQIGAFALFLGVIFLQPSFLTVKALGAPENQRALDWLPPYWFMGLLSELGGVYPNPVMAPLARRAVVGLAFSIVIAGIAFLLSYLRTLRKIAEEPDILPGSRGGIWLPQFGNLPRTALVQFTLRTLARSRQHRMNLAFFLGLGFAMIAISKAVLPSTLLMLCLAVLGTRVAFSRPLDLRANWLFKVTPVTGGASCRNATRVSLFALSLFPVWIGGAAALLWNGPWLEAVKHLVLLALFGALLVEVSLIGFHKIPFTCSYLPGKSKIHVLFVAALFLLPSILIEGVEGEQWIVANIWRYAAALAILLAAIHETRQRFRPNEEIQFEEFAQNELISLNL